MYDGHLATLSNRQSWNDSVELLDNDTGEPVDISTATEIAVQVAPRGGVDLGGYGGASFGTTPLLTASLSNGKVQHVQTGIFSFAFTKSDMRQLCGGIYSIEITIEKDGETESLILGSLPVREGVVTL
jgi:hypothetical protein